MDAIFGLSPHGDVAADPLPAYLAQRRGTVNAGILTLCADPYSKAAGSRPGHDVISAMATRPPPLNVKPAKRVTRCKKRRFAHLDYSAQPMPALPHTP